MKITPENITELKPNEVFVFGSNLAGRHGAGAAKTARAKFGAIYGVGAGPTGRCYAIPTKNRFMAVLKLDAIESWVAAFVRYAALNPHQEFLVTKIGCGLSGYKPRDIAPLFFRAGVPTNVSLPREFLDCYRA